MKKQASARHCFVCGVENIYGLQMKFYETGPDEVLAEVVVPNHFQGYPGVVHGGIVASILDEVSGRTFMGDGMPRFMVTARLTVRYRRPVPVGVNLILKGHRKEDRGRVAVAIGEVYDENGTLLAEAETVLSQMPDEIAGRFVDDGIEWKVYPDEEGSHDS